MLGDITLNEVNLLNQYEVLNANYQKELNDYMRYLLSKQYRREVMIAVFHNKIIINLLHGLLYLMEKDDFDVAIVKKRVGQMKQLYYGVFEQVHIRYSELIEDLDSNEIVREFGKNSFETLNQVLEQGEAEIIRFEIINFYHEYNRLSKKRDARQIIAV